MSQKKVDAYKASKANREKIMKKEKAILRLEKLAALVVAVAAVGWVCYSVYDKVASTQEEVVTETVMDVTALNDYLDDVSLQLDEDAAETGEETEEPEEAAEDADAAAEETVDEDAAAEETADEDAAEEETADTDAAEEETADADAAADTDAAADGADEAAEE